jgi:hypothetical protein
MHLPASNARHAPSIDATYTEHAPREAAQLELTKLSALQRPRRSSRSPPVSRNYTASLFAISSPRRNATKRQREIGGFPPTYIFERKEYLLFGGGGGRSTLVRIPGVDHPPPGPRNWPSNQTHARRTPPSSEASEEGISLSADSVI